MRLGDSVLAPHRRGPGTPNSTRFRKLCKFDTIQRKHVAPATNRPASFSSRNFEEMMVAV